ncbi:hypothetical protein GGR57DRAFT_468549 [Xylariaceae sp. FL1272]|nr:hypothetical protein GGR57DRAFT_468549 [Xylariaceae sp. FL1272]
MGRNLVVAASITSRSLSPSRVAALRKRDHSVQPTTSHFYTAWTRPLTTTTTILKSPRNHSPAMTTITLKSPAVSVSLPEGFSESQLLSFQPFNNWLNQLTHSLSLQQTNPSHPFHKDPYKLHSITIQSYDLFGPRVGFLKLQARISNNAGEHLPGGVFLRGPSVGMLVILIPDDAPKDTDERYVVLTVQARVPAGSLEFAELPAGMVDDGPGDKDGEGQKDGKFAGAAAKEIEEELGIQIKASELTCLSDLAAHTSSSSSGNTEGEGLYQAMYPSAGGCDEFVPIYMHERRVPRDTLKEWTGKLTGLRDEGEKITLKLVRLRDLWWEGRRDSKALAAFALWEGARREGRLKL